MTERNAWPSPASIVSTRYQFLYVSVPKNASSTLRFEFQQEPYFGQELIYGKVPASQRDTLFTFTALRHPATRLLSAYQEVSIRHDNQTDQYPDFDFWQLPDQPERFDAFLETLKEDKFDAHLWDQADYLRRIRRMDLYLRTESLEEDLTGLAARLGFKPPSGLPMRRSRQSRIDKYQYDSYIIELSSLSSAQVRQIEDLYADDMRLYESIRS